MSQTTATPTTGLNLTKGEKIDLTKSTPGLTKIGVGLGWDPNKGTGEDFDLDASILLLNDQGKITHPEDQNKSLCWYNNLTLPGMVHSADDRTGGNSEKGDDETIMIDLSKVDANVDQILCFVTIYEAVPRKQHFGQVNNAYMRVFNADGNKELLRFDLTEDYGQYNAITFGRFYKRSGEWKFEAVGTGFNGDIASFVQQYL